MNEIRNIKLILSYDGSAYHGWQIQKNADTVQQRLADACERILGERVTVHGCSRTDSGVHANEFHCNFRTESKTDIFKIKKGLNAVLPDDIAVISCEDVPKDFHSRFDAKGKEYVYMVWNAEHKNPFLTNRALHYPYRLDCELLDEQCKDYIGTFDFSAFCSSGSSVTDTVRTITDFKVRRDGNLVVFSVRGNGFLYNMVRIMVGTLLEINSGKLPKGSIKDIILSKDRNNAGITAKAQGLYLNKVFYDDIQK